MPVGGPSVPCRGATPATMRFAFAFSPLTLFRLSFRQVGFTFAFQLVGLFLSAVWLYVTFLSAVVAVFVLVFVHRERSVWWFHFGGVIAFVVDSFCCVQNHFFVGD